METAKYHPLSRINQLLPSGVEVTRKTATRWAKEGYRGIVLETLQVGNRRYVTREAVERFIRAAQLHEKYSGSGFQDLLTRASLYALEKGLTVE